MKRSYIDEADAARVGLLRGDNPLDDPAHRLLAEGVEHPEHRALGEVAIGGIMRDDLDRRPAAAKRLRIFGGFPGQSGTVFDADAFPHLAPGREAEDAAIAAADIDEHVARAQLDRFEAAADRNIVECRERHAVAEAVGDRIAAAALALRRVDIEERVDRPGPQTPRADNHLPKRRDAP